MNDLGVIDHFLNVFGRYIDSGFGLLGGEIAFLTATLVTIDITLAGLLWAMGGTDDVLSRLIKKTLYVGTFAFILTNFNALSNILFRSFAGLGLTAAGGGLTAAELLQPGHLAKIGVDAARPILTQISAMAGFPAAFLNLDSIVVLFLAWLVVLVSFFVLAVQLFVTLLEFKLTTLAGFVLVPFALWNRTAFLAERVLGNVVSAGIKVLVLAVIVGIGSTIFGEFGTAVGVEPSLDQALAVMLAALALLGLGLFGPGIATGLVAGGPQLGAGAAAGTALAAGGLAVASGAPVAGGTRLAVRGASALGSAATLASPSRNAAAASSDPHLGGNANARASAMSANDRAPPTEHGKDGARASGAPAWVQRLQRGSTVLRGGARALHAVRHADRGGSGASPRLSDDDRSER